MPRYVALLRGINVGGNQMIKMADLRAMFERAGATDVETYINSGNVVFSHASRSAAKLTTELEAALSLTMCLRTAAQMEAIVEAVPFPTKDPKALHVFFLRKRAPVDLDPKTYLPEKWELIGDELYLFLPNGLGRSKLAATIARKPPGKDATARNWRTVETLTAMCRSA